LPEAEELCHRVLARTPNHPLALYIIGGLGLGFDDELALEYFARAVGAAPQIPGFTSVWPRLIRSSANSISLSGTWSALAS
jgi:hypothetical protein